MAHLRFIAISVFVHALALLIYFYSSTPKQSNEQYLVGIADKQSMPSKAAIIPISSNKNSILINKEIKELGAENLDKPAPGSPEFTNHSQLSSKLTNHLPDWIQTEIEYPIRSRQKGETGIVKIFVKIDEKANISQLEIRQSSGFVSLDRAALNALQKANYKKGEIRSEIVEIEFRLN